MSENETLPPPVEPISELDKYIPVALNEVKQDQSLPFALYIYFPLNKKMLLYRVKNGMVETDKLQKFKDLNFNRFYVEKAEKDDYIKYTSKEMAQAFDNPNATEEEKTELLHKKSTDILKSLYDDAENTPELLSQLVEINNTFMDTIVKSPTDPYKQIMKAMAKSGGADSHSGICQSMAVFTMMGLGYTNHKALSDMGVAAMLHDIGKARLPMECSTIRVSQMPEKIHEKYTRHPQLSIDMINKHPSKVSNESKLIIKQHHENIDGSGFPDGLRSLKIYELSKIFSIIDELHYRISGDYDGEKRTIKQGFESIIAQNSVPEGPVRFDKKLLAKIADLFKGKEEKEDASKPNNKK